MTDSYIDDLLAGRTTPGFTLGSSPDIGSPVESLLTPAPVRSPAAVEDALRINPDEEAKRRKEAAAAGVSPEAAEAAPDEVKTRARFNEIDRLLSDAPATSLFMSVPDNARIAHDDVESLSAWERVSRSFLHGAALNERGRVGNAMRRNPQSPEVRAELDAVNKRLEALGHSTDGWMGFVTGLSEMLGQMTESFGQPAAAIDVAGGGAVGAALGAFGGPLAPATSTAGAIAGMAAGIVSHRANDVLQIEAGNSYADQIELGVDPEVAAWTSLGVGLTNMGLELASDALMIKPLTTAAKAVFKKGVKEAFASKPVVEMAREFVTAYGVGVGSEVGTEILQEVSAIVGEEIGKAFSDGEFESLTQEQVTERLEGIALQTFKSVALLAGFGPSVRLSTDIKLARDAERDRAKIEELHKNAGQSTLVKRDPEKAAEHGAESLKQAGVEYVYLPAEKLVEAAEKSGDAAAMYDTLGVRQQVDDAFITGSDVKVSAEGFARLVQSDEPFAALADHIRMKPDALTAEEAKTIDESGMADALAEVDAFLLSLKPKEVKPEDGAPTAEASEIDDAGPATPPAQVLRNTGPALIAEEELGLQAFFRSAAEAGMTEKQYESYLLALARAKEAPQIAAAERALKQQQRELSDEWKATREVEREAVVQSLSNEPVFTALNAIQAERLDKASVIAALPNGEAQLAELPKSQGRSIFTTAKSEQGIDAAAFAELHGFSGPDEMLFAMIDRGAFDAAVEAQTDKVMREKHGGVLTRAQEIKAAIQELHNDKTQAVLVAELNALREAKSNDRMTSKLVQQAARDKMQGHRIEDIQTNVYLHAAKRAARAAAKLLRGGDRKGAARTKFHQVINFAMSQEAFRVRDEVRKKRKYLQKFAKPPKKGDTLPVRYREQINSILAGVNLRAQLSGANTSVQQMMADFVKAEAARGTIIKGLPPYVRKAAAQLEQDARRSFTDMTLAEFREMHDTVKTLEKAGREENKMARASDKATRQEIVDELVSLIRANLTPRTNLDPHEGRLAKLGYIARGYVTTLFNVDTVLRQIDGWTNLGAAYTNIKGRLDQAYTEGYHPGQVGYVRRQKEAAQRMLELYSVFDAAERAAFGKPMKLEGVREPMTRGKLLALLLNTGNEDNIQALIDSGQFTLDEIQTAQAAATEKEWNFVQSMWDYLDSYWPEVKTAVQRRTNTTPGKVAARPVVTAHGTFAGGYYPLRYDSLQAVIPAPQDLDELADRAKFGNFVSSHTADGHTKSRTGSGKRPVLLNLFVANSHVDQVIYDLEVSDAITDIYRILHHPDFKRALAEQGYLDRWHGLDLWLGDMVSGEIHSSHWAESSLRYLRTGFTLAKLGWNVGTAVLQPLGLLQTMVVVGKRDTFQAMRMMLSPGAWYGKDNVFKFVSEQSGFMAQREDSFNKDIVDAQRVMRSTLRSQSKTAQVVEASFFFMIKKMQRFVDTVTWLAAKRRGMREFAGDEQKARTYADRMVARSQASGNFGERTALERGSLNNKTRQTELVRAFTVLASYFMAKTNIAYERVNRTNFRSPASVASLAVDMALLYMIEAALAELVRNQEPEDDESWAWFVGSATFRSVMAGFPVIREFTSEAEGFRGGGLLSFVIKDFAKVTNQVSQGELDVGLFKALNNMGGTLLHYPASQVNKTAEGISRWMSGEEVTILGLVMGPDYDG